MKKDDVSGIVEKCGVGCMGACASGRTTKMLEEADGLMEEYCDAFESLDDAPGLFAIGLVRIVACRDGSSSSELDDTELPFLFARAHGEEMSFRRLEAFEGGAVEKCTMTLLGLRSLRAPEGHYGNGPWAAVERALVQSSFEGAVYVDEDVVAMPLFFSSRKDAASAIGLIDPCLDRRMISSSDLLLVQMLQVVEVNSACLPERMVPLDDFIAKHEPGTGKAS